MRGTKPLTPSTFGVFQQDLHCFRLSDLFHFTATFVALQ